MSTELLRTIQALGLDLSNGDDVRRLGAMVADILHDGTTHSFLYGMHSVESKHGSPSVAAALKMAAQGASDAEFFDKMNRESEYES
jgi:hypothetical protein